MWHPLIEEKDLWEEAVLSSILLISQNQLVIIGVSAS